MFSNNDFYHLDEAEKSLEVVFLVMKIQIEVETLKALLIQKGIFTESDFEATKEYVCTMPTIKAQPEICRQMYEQLEASKNRYKNDPQQHLKDLFKAKMNGTIK